MATKESTFSFAGVVRSPKGELKIKFANDTKRIEKLVKVDGNTDPRMFALGGDFKKPQAVLELRNLPDLQDPETRALIDDQLTKFGIDVKALGEPVVAIDEDELEDEQDEPEDEQDDEDAQPEDAQPDEPVAEEPVAEEPEQIEDDEVVELPDFGDIAVENDELEMA